MKEHLGVNRAFARGCKEHNRPTPKEFKTTLANVSKLVRVVGELEKVTNSLINEGAKDDRSLKHIESLSQLQNKLKDAVERTDVLTSALRDITDRVPKLRRPEPKHLVGRGSVDPDSIESAFKVELPLYDAEGGYGYMGVLLRGRATGRLQ